MSPEEAMVYVRLRSSSRNENFFKPNMAIYIPQVVNGESFVDIDVGTLNDEGTAFDMRRMTVPRENYNDANKLRDFVTVDVLGKPYASMKNTNFIVDIYRV